MTHLFRHFPAKVSPRKGQATSDSVEQGKSIKEIGYHFGYDPIDGMRRFCFVMNCYRRIHDYREDKRYAGAAQSGLLLLLRVIHR